MRNAAWLQGAADRTQSSRWGPGLPWEQPAQETAAICQAASSKPPPSSSARGLDPPATVMQLLRHPSPDVCRVFKSEATKASRAWGREGNGHHGR